MARVAEQTSHTSMTELAFRVPPRCAAWVNVYSCIVLAEHVKREVPKKLDTLCVADQDAVACMSERAATLVDKKHRFDADCPEPFKTSRSYFDPEAGALAR